MTSFPSFKKPFFEEIFGSKTRPSSYPYPTSLWKKLGAFPLLILDGGAFFFTHRHLGGATGRDFLKGLQDGRLLKPWQKGGKLDWDKALNDARRWGRKVPIEKHVWLNRLYFLLPIAQRFYQGGEEAWAQKWWDYFDNWRLTHPRPRQEAPDRWDLFFSSVWWDMQPAWRLMILLHSAFLLGSSRSLDKSKWEILYQSILEHAEKVYSEILVNLRKKGLRGNHFLHQGVALLYAGALFPEFPESKEWVQSSREVLRQYISEEIRPDGGNIEASPSYSHFIARLCLESWLLLRQNRLPEVRELRKSIQQQYNFLSQIQSPDGKTLQCSDSYAMDATADLHLVSKLFPLRLPAGNRSVCFKDSGFAVLRNKQFQVYLDASGMDLWHHHVGKPNLLVYAQGVPLLVDSGCCDYDLPEREGWLKKAEAHNTVVVEGKWNITRLELKGFEATRYGGWVMVEAWAHSKTASYTWRRSVRLYKSLFNVKDEIRSSQKLKAYQIFHFGNVGLNLSKNRQTAFTRTPNIKVVLGPYPPFLGKLKRKVHPAVGPDNRIFSSNSLTCEVQGGNLRLKSVFILT